MTELVQPSHGTDNAAAIPAEPSNWYRIAAGFYGLAVNGVERLRLSAAEFLISTGIVRIIGTITAGGLLTNGLQIGTNGPLIYSGSNIPTIAAAVKGSLYLRTDGSSGTTRLYVATDTAGTWTAVNTVA